MVAGRKMEIGHEKANMKKFKETELRLGLPGGGGGVEGDHGLIKKSNIINNNNINGKRGFEEIVDLKLNLASKVPSEKLKMIIPSNVPPKPPPKEQVVGWPPVRSSRKNILTVQKSGGGADEEKEKLISSNVIGGGGAFVKVSLDGAPYLRKVDLKMYKTYKELCDALGNLFSSSTIGNCGMKDFMNESKLMDLLSGSDFVPTYEDKDGDWMLVGDVPWEMFVNSCKRLRIMKGTEAKGLAPRAMEKCKNRN